MHGGGSLHGLFDPVEFFRDAFVAGCHVVTFEVGLPVWVQCGRSTS